MKLTVLPFRYDVVEFSLLDLIKLALGKKLKSGALIAVRRGVEP